jgi:hypothetical protein
VFGLIDLEFLFNEVLVMVVQLENGLSNYPLTGVRKVEFVVACRVEVGEVVSVS